MMLRTCTLISLIALSVCAHAQPVITNCENFAPGNELIFQQCSTNGVTAGPGGAGQTWNFSALSPLADTSIEDMVLPSSTPYASLFPTATIVEKYSNGTYVYVHATADTSYLVGYADSVNVDTITYGVAPAFAVRPVTYLSHIVTPFTDKYRSATFNLSGAGTDTIYGDGYGTLVLPARTYNNVLRLRLAQVQSDTSSFGVGITSTISYVWFDSSFTSALLKIDSTNTAGTITKSVEYLVKESPSREPIVTPKLLTAFFYPNPASYELTVTTTQPGELTLTSVTGAVVLRTQTRAYNTSITVSTSGLPAGVYTATFQSQYGGVQTEKVVVQR